MSWVPKIHPYQMQLLNSTDLAVIICGGYRHGKVEALLHDRIKVAEMAQRETPIVICEFEEKPFAPKRESIVTDAAYDKWIATMEERQQKWEHEMSAIVGNVPEFIIPQVIKDLFPA